MSVVVTQKKQVTNVDFPVSADFFANDVRFSGVKYVWNLSVQIR